MQGEHARRAAAVAGWRQARLGNAGAIHESPLRAGGRLLKASGGVRMMPVSRPGSDAQNDVCAAGSGPC